MAHQCVHCSKIYNDSSKEILFGCSCGSKFFFYIKEEKLQQILAAQKTELELSTPEKEQIEKDVREIAGIPNEETPVFLDFESIKIIKPGKYLLDLTKLFDREGPRVYQLEDGKYIIDLAYKTKQENKE